MEEMQKVALAYYENGSPEVRLRVHELFCSMDTNGDRWINMSEFMELLNREGYNNAYVNSSLFTELDRDRNGVLDFNEFLTLYYVIKTQNGFCYQCWRCLKGLYFTCVTCFDCPAATTFDLCPDCYRVSNRRPVSQHPHTNFVDSGLLLRAKRRSTAAPSSSSQAIQQLMQPTTNMAAIQPYNHQNVHEARRQIGMREAVRALEIALAAAAVGVAVFCSIM
ncbi:hypothetical protein QQ045_007359 [Rhodiola kirilowii]